VRGVIGGNDTDAAWLEFLRLLKFRLVVGETRAGRAELPEDAFEPLVAQGDELPAQSYLGHHKYIELMLNDVRDEFPTFGCIFDFGEVGEVLESNTKYGVSFGSLNVAELFDVHCILIVAAQGSLIVSFETFSFASANCLFRFSFLLIVCLCFIPFFPKSLPGANSDV
jgi:hypothetical protein